MQKEKLMPIINMENQASLPRNFRMAAHSFIPKEMSPSIFPSTYGLSELQASASGQFSQQSLKKIREVIPVEKIILFDLREESHGFINGMAISWYGENDWGNRDKSLKEIEQDEKWRLQNALREKHLHVYQKNSDNPSDTLAVYVQEAYSEEDLAQKMGFHYVRIPVTDHLKPSDEDVDFFIQFIKTHILNKDKSDFWIHFHCSAGRGRSTTFISMYDMMRNSSKVSFADILARQAMIGGKDLTDPFDVSDWRYPHHFERLHFLVDFYTYCTENPRFDEPWSSWIKK